MPQKKRSKRYSEGPQSGAASPSHSSKGAFTAAGDDARSLRERERGRDATGDEASSSRGQAAASAPGEKATKTVSVVATKGISPARVPISGTAVRVPATAGSAFRSALFGGGNEDDGTPVAVAGSTVSAGRGGEGGRLGPPGGVQRLEKSPARAPPALDLNSLQARPKTPDFPVTPRSLRFANGPAGSSGGFGGTGGMLSSGLSTPGSGPTNEGVGSGGLPLIGAARAKFLLEQWQDAKVTLVTHMSVHPEIVRPEMQRLLVETGGVEAACTLLSDRAVSDEVFMYAMFFLKRVLNIPEASSRMPAKHIGSIRERAWMCMERLAVGKGQRYDSRSVGGALAVLATAARNGAWPMDELADFARHAVRSTDMAATHGDVSIVDVGLTLAVVTLSEDREHMPTVCHMLSNGSVTRWTAQMNDVHRVSIVLLANVAATLAEVQTVDLPVLLRVILASLSGDEVDAPTTTRWERDRGADTTTDAQVNKRGPPVVDRRLIAFLQQHAARGLANLAVAPGVHAAMLDAGVVPALARIVAKPSLHTETLRHCLRTLVTLTRSTVDASSATRAADELQNASDAILRIDNLAKGDTGTLLGRMAGTCLEYVALHRSMIPGFFERQREREEEEAAAASARSSEEASAIRRNSLRRDEAARILRTSSASRLERLLQRRPSLDDVHAAGILPDPAMSLSSSMRVRRESLKEQLSRRPSLEVLAERTQRASVDRRSSLAASATGSFSRSRSSTGVVSVKTRASEADAKKAKKKAKKKDKVMRITRDQL